MRYGVFLARMQPVHNAHLYMVRKALSEQERVLVVLGSENKVDMLRNPYHIDLRVNMLRECFTSEENDRLSIITLPDWPTESDHEGAKIWGRYFYYNVVSRIGQKRFSIYYSDDISILDEWFSNTEVKQFISYRHFQRDTLFDGLSATKIRQAFIEGDIDYVTQYCPPSVTRRFTELSAAYKDVVQDPVADFSME